MPHQLDAWLYKGGRPNRVARLLNGLWSRLAAAGRSPEQLYSLEVRGRRSGRRLAFPVVVADHEGERYLVAMLGRRANWVANVRAAGGRAVLRHGGREDVLLEEVDPAARGPILRRYLQLAPGARPHIPVDPEAPPAAFEAVAADYPVFLIRPAADAMTPTLQAVLDAFNAHDVDAILAFFTEDCTFDTPRGDRLVGKQEVRKGFQARFDGIPDIHYGDDRHWSCGDRGVSEWTIRGTQVSGEPIEVRGCDLFEFTDGKVSRKDSFWKIIG
ncbi:MAG: nitroreductase/quinone reductase family protein [Baekduiaceae bacterium]